MKHLLPFFLFIAVSTKICAQQAKDVVRVNNGTDISKTMSFQERFYFDKFQDGKVFFRNGRVVKARMNYSLVHGEVQFIDAKKDTLILNDKELIRQIAVGVDTFYFYPRFGHIKKVIEFKDVTLAEKPLISIMGSERHSAYGQYTSTSAISTYSSFTNSSGLQQNLQGGDKVLLKKETAYFFIDKNRDVLLANKGSVLKVFSKHKRALNDYFRDNKVEIYDVNDLVKLLEYASSL